MRKCSECKRKLPIDQQPDFYHSSIIEVYKLKKKHKLTNIELIKLIGISKRTLYRWFNKNGSKKKVKPEYIELLKLKLKENNNG